MTFADVLLLTQDEQTVAAVRSVLKSRALPDTAGVCDSIMDLRTRLSRKAAGAQPRLAVIDIDEAPERMLADLGKITAAYPHTWFVVASRDFDKQRLLRAMQAGARHFVQKKSMATELDQVLEHLLTQQPHTTARLGVILSVFSCSGGCGATTVAVNLANEL